MPTMMLTASRARISRGVPLSSASARKSRIAWNRNVPEPQAGSRTFCSSGAEIACRAIFEASRSGGVILAETVALLAINQRFVQCLHHVTLDLSKAEAADMGHNTSDEFRAFRVGDDPVEEIALDRAVDACVRQSRPRQQPSRLVLVQPEDGEGDAFGDNDEIGVLEPQRVAFYVVAVDNFEKLRPELAEP